MIRRLLITGAGTGTAFSYAITAAQRHPDVALVTADVNPAALVSAAVFGESHRQLPPIADHGFAQALRQLIENERITHYLPILDPEIRFAVENRGTLAVRVVAPPERFVVFAVDKHRYPVALAELGLHTPRLFDAAAAPLPCMSKRPGSFGSRGTQRIESREELAGLPDDAFLQEWVDGPEYTVDCCPTPDGGQPFCSVRRRIEVKAGVCTKALIEPNEELEQVADRLVKAFAVDQPFCFQAIHDGNYWVTDVNPRLGAGTAMSTANGSNFFAAHLAQIFGGDPQAALTRHRMRCVVTRQFVEYVSDAACA